MKQIQFKIVNVDMNSTSSHTPLEAYVNEREFCEVSSVSDHRHWTLTLSKSSTSFQHVLLLLVEAKSFNEVYRNLPTRWIKDGKLTRQNPFTTFDMVIFCPVNKQLPHCLCCTDLTRHSQCYPTKVEFPGSFNFFCQSVSHHWECTYPTCTSVRVWAVKRNSIINMFAINVQPREDH